MVNLARMGEMCRVFPQKGNRWLIGPICGEIFSEGQERRNCGGGIANIISNMKSGKIKETNGRFEQKNEK